MNVNVLIPVIVTATVKHVRNITAKTVQEHIAAKTEKLKIQNNSGIRSAIR